MTHRQDIFEHAVVKIMHPIVIVFAAIVLIWLVLHIVDMGKQNQTYTKFTTCVLSVPAHDRDQKQIDNCYNRVQKETGVNIDKY